MFDRRRILLGLGLVLSLSTAVAYPGAASAADLKPYSAVAFDAAKAAGKPILIDVTASWCPTCKAQHPILSDLESQPKFKDLVVLNVDFDSQKDVLRQFGVRMQSTLIGFKGDKETARSTGDTKAASIAQLLDTTL